MPICSLSKRSLLPSLTVYHQIWQTKWKLKKKEFHYNQLLVNNSIRNLLHFHLTHLSAILRIPFVFNVKYKEHFWVSWSMVEVLNFFESQLKQPISLRTILQTFYNSLEWPALEWLNSSMNRRGHGLRTPNEGINQINLKIWADVADKICFGRT